MAGKFGVEEFESPPCAEQERRSLDTAKTGGPCDMAAHKVHTCYLRLVERAVLCARYEAEGGVEGAGL
jgi:hypothetical protein